MTLFIGAILQCFCFRFFVRGFGIELFPEFIGWLLILDAVDRRAIGGEAARQEDPVLRQWLLTLIGVTGLRFALGIFAFLGYGDALWFRLVCGAAILTSAILGAFAWMRILKRFRLEEEETGVQRNAENAIRAYRAIPLLQAALGLYGLLPFANWRVLGVMAAVLVLAGVNFVSEVYYICRYEMLR